MKWNFFRSARCVQVKLENGESVAALGELDQKLWTVLSASASGLRFDPATLKMLDSDGDGRIRVPEVLSAVEWLKSRFINLDFLFNRKPEIKLSDVNAETPEGKELLATFKGILSRDNRAECESITLADVIGATKTFDAQQFNGDGVITAKCADDKNVADLISKIISVKGAVADRSGEDGIDQAKADAFFADAEAYLKWSADSKVATTKWKVATTNSDSCLATAASAYKAYLVVKGKIDEYFTLPEDIPLLADDPTPVLPLRKGVNPAWQTEFAAFSNVLSNVLSDSEDYDSITRAQWIEVKGLFESYGSWLNSKGGDSVESLGAEEIAKILDGGKMQAAVNDLIARDNALADESAKFADAERALRYAANLLDWLCNYVNQVNLYENKDENVFRTGDLYIDGRVCKLCFHVANEGAHSALAAKSKCCLLYVKLSRPATGEAREICAVVTAGSTASLYAGRNGIFYDCDGKDWDAVVAKVVEAQVSLREAFWAPWAKIATTISEQCKKFLSSKQDAAVSKVGADATAAASAPAGQPAGANGAALASSVAALGVGVGMAGAACAGLIGLVAGLPIWKVLAGVAAIILLVSLPSVVLAWFKLRARDLGAILNAGGWAVNRPLYFSMGLARTFTRPAKLPVGAAVSCDPHASCAWKKYVLAAIVILGIAAGVYCRFACPCCKKCAETPKADAAAAEQSVTTTEVKQ